MSFGCVLEVELNICYKPTETYRTLRHVAKNPQEETSRLSNPIGFDMFSYESSMKDFQSLLFTGYH